MVLKGGVGVSGYKVSYLNSYERPPKYYVTHLGRRDLVNRDDLRLMGEGFTKM